MATWDAADLLARCKRLAFEPSTSETTSDADWYALLTEAEAHWKPVVTIHYPGPMLTAPTLLTNAGTDKTFTFPSSVTPLYVELYTGLTGRPLTCGAYWDSGADFVLEGGTVRITRGRTFSFEDGAPYARYVTPAVAIAAGVDSTISPSHLRALLVYHACALWAARGGFQDPAVYEAMEQKAAFGNPLIPGDVGLIGALKMQNPMHGMAAINQESEYRWWKPNGG